LETTDLDKIFTPKEQVLISNAENPDIMVWNGAGRKQLTKST
jgi:hypothetical protein